MTKAGIQDYPSRLGDRNSKRFETFSYLPEMNATEIKAQISYMVKQGWNPAVEHVEPERAGTDYWYMWKLPMFGETKVAAIQKELKACKDANPGNHVRLIGYDNLRQTQGQSMVIYRGD